MLRIHAPWALSVFAVGILAADLGAAEPAEGILKEKGLRRSGTTFVLPEEAEVQKKIKEAAALYRQLSVAVMQQRAFVQGTADKKALIQELTQQRIALNRQLGQATTAGDNNRLIGMINGITDQLNLLREEDADPDASNRVKSEVPRQREAFVQAVLDLRQLVDDVSAKYEGLAKDDEVKGALNSLNEKAKAKVTLGPSRTFVSNVKLLEKVEASVLSETVELRRDNGVFWLDVTFNGKVTKPMVFDTGAGLTTLPAELAAEIGLRPSASDETIQCHVADGSVVEAKKMTIASMRVGKFTVKDIACAVMPAEKKDVPPLLGGSFHRLFTYKFSPESAKLVLSKVELPEDAKSPKAKSSRMPKAKKAK